jgi:3-hydroxyacyl-CoA dehydrogenase/enoyl-CoA hydratase/3-hydroxybutyryl-CoA epimerase
MEEGILDDAREADVGAILGFGFAPFTGGPLSLIDGMGAEEFVKRCDALKTIFGPRFSAPKILLDMAAQGASFYKA